jgi:hypothetical protein
VDASLLRDLTTYVIDDTLERSRRLRAFRQEIGKLQRELRGHLTTEGWDAYLRLESAVNARAEAQLRALFDRMLVLHSRRP